MCQAHYNTQPNKQFKAHSVNRANNVKPITLYYLHGHFEQRRACIGFKRLKRDIAGRTGVTCMARKEFCSYVKWPDLLIHEIRRNREAGSLVRLR